ncbi:Reverse transcriptase (RNA-dependent DNA polymerase) [Popillia japonica]|uniref:Reverse transcriptase (RNA-dependent DNA polymerase) n=1 Tax=Popillia japonica TaxID=7064 RepID=A0AAW1JFC3_POPJA
MHSSSLSSNKTINLPIHADYENCICIPAHCQVIKQCYVNNNVECVVSPKEVSSGLFLGRTLAKPIKNVNNNVECVVSPKEVSSGLFLGRTLAKPIKNKIPVQFLNTTNKDIILKNFSPQTELLRNYEICSFGEIDKYSVDRIDKLLGDLNLQHLSTAEKFSIQRICTKYADIFHVPGDKLGTTSIYRQEIPLKKNYQPDYKNPYRFPHAQKQEVHRQIDHMLKKGIIENPTSEWSSPVLIIPKKADLNGEKRWRMVIDYRLLNQEIEDDKFPLPNITEILDSLSDAIYFSQLDLSQDDKFPLPNITEILDSLSDAIYFSQLDLSQGYHQIKLDHKSRPCTAFTMDRGQYQMTRLPMGIKISRSAYSKAMTIAMSGLNYDSCLIYLYDLIVYGNNLIEHNKNLVKVFEKLRQVTLYHQMVYQPDKCKIEAIKEYPLAKNGAEVKRFIAFANNYRKFIPNFAEIASPLNELT